MTRPGLRLCVTVASIAEAAGIALWNALAVREAQRITTSLISGFGAPQYAPRTVSGSVLMWLVQICGTLRIRFSAGRCALSVLVLTIWFAPAAGGAEWVRFRGPNGSGIGQAENLPVKWTEQDYNWRVALPGVGHSSPVVWGGRVFVTSGDPKTARRFVLCLKTSDGGVLWQREYESKQQEMNGFNSYASSTPTLDEERVYICWTTSGEVTLLALTHEGKDVWRRNLGPYDGQHGSGSSPIVFEDLVLLGGYQGSKEDRGKCTFVAVDRKSGETLWQLERHGDDVDWRASYSTPLVYQPEGGPPQIVFCDNWSHGLTSLDPKTGQVLWQARGALPERSVGSPILAAGLIVASCGTEEPTRVTAVRPPTQGAEAKVVWTCTKSPPYVPTPVAKDDLLFLWNDGGCVTCLRAATGEQVWRQRVGSDFLGSPVCVGDRLYCISRPGDVFVIAAGDKFELLGRNPLGEQSHATPAVAGGALYLRTFSHLISIGGKK